MNKEYQLNAISNPVILHKSVYIKDIIDACNKLNTDYNEIHEFINDNNAISSIPTYKNILGTSKNTRIEYPIGCIKLFKSKDDIYNMIGTWKILDLTDTFISIGNTDMTVKPSTIKSHTHSTSGSINMNANIGKSSETRRSSYNVGHDDYTYTNTTIGNTSIHIDGNTNNEGDTGSPKSVHLIHAVRIK